ncbi:MAG: DUF4230 domain-containing protein [Desulfobacteraceae bacterium]|nr:DUF4230 domain-containing protein [Desulfobacteraceae bacterium]
MKQLAKMAVVAVITALVVMGVSYWLTQRGPDVRVTVQSIRKIAYLATVEYRLAALMDQTYRSQSLFTKVDSSRMIAYYTGTVKGSVDLDKADITIDNQPEVGRVTIHFKPGSIVVSGVEIIPGEDSYKEITCYTKPLFNPPTDEQRDRLRGDALKIIRQKAIDQGIVAKTMENAKTVLSEFVGAFGLQAMIEFDEKAYDPLAK